MVGLIAVVLVLLVAISLLGRSQTARGAAQTAADLGALAAAQQLVGSGGGPPVACGTAREVVAANGAILTGCSLLGQGVVRVTCERSGGLGVARASARAGPSPGQPRVNVSSGGGGGS